MSIENRVVLADSPDAQAYLAKLNAPNQTNVIRITEMLDIIAGEADKHVFEAEREREIIFGAYAIGGWIDKEPPREDIDLLVVTNAEWEDIGYIQTPPEWGRVYISSSDSFIGMVASYFGESGFNVKIPDSDDIPDEYSEGAEPRMMLRIKPIEQSACLPIDVVYISAGYSEPRITSFEDFYAQDVADDGQPIGRLPLVETVVTVPPIQYRP